MSQKRIEFADVRARARGQWSRLLPLLGPFGPAVEKAPKRGHVACPFHKGKNGDGFRLFDDYQDTGGGICNTCGPFATGIDLIVAHKGCSIAEAFILVAEELGMCDRDGNRLETTWTPPPRNVEAENRRAAEQAREDDSAAKALSDTRDATVAADHADAEPLRLYLANRGLDPALCPPSLRLHPALPYYRRAESGKYELVGKYPAMIASVTALNGRCYTLHRTYITQDGHKAPVDKAKKLMRTRSTYEIAGCAVRLGLPEGPILAVTEGIETGLAVQAATGIPVWAGISTTIMAKLAVPEHVRTILVFADLDRKFAGQIHAQMLCERMLADGRESTFYLPPGPIVGDAEKSVDWRDVWEQRGRAGFPQIFPRPQPVEAGGTSSVTNFTPRQTSRLMG